MNLKMLGKNKSISRGLEKKRVRGESVLRRQLFKAIGRRLEGNVAVTAEWNCNQVRFAVGLFITCNIVKSQAPFNFRYMAVSVHL